MTWEYPERLDKHCTNKISVYRNRVNGALTLRSAEDFATSQIYIGYSIREAKRMFRNYLKEMKI